MQDIKAVVTVIWFKSQSISRNRTPFLKWNVVYISLQIGIIKFMNVLTSSWIFICMNYKFLNFLITCKRFWNFNESSIKFMNFHLMNFYFMNFCSFWSLCFLGVVNAQQHQRTRLSENFPFMQSTKFVIVILKFNVHEI